MTVSLPLQDQLHQRYVGSFKRQFKEQEARSLQQRTRQRPGRAGPDCVCLVAVKQSNSSSAEVVGTLDVEPTGPVPAQEQKVPEVRLFLRNVGDEEGDQSICLRDVVASVARSMRPSHGLSYLQGAAYVLNVVVSSKHRRQGIGIMLMAAAADMAKQEWASSRMCARVSAQNHVGFPHNLSVAS